MSIKISILLASLFAGQFLFAQNSAEILTYISTYKEVAMSEMQRTGIPASIILAQGIHETDAGTSDLVKQSNNHFGIKCKDDWRGSVVYHDDDKRGECFRSYNSPLDSYVDHSDFLKNSPRYKFLFKIDPLNFEGWANGLKKAGYATNSRYAQILIKLIKDYNLQQYCLIAMGKLSPTDEVQVTVQINNLRADSLSETDSKSGKAASPKAQYPSGEFVINGAHVIYAKSGTALLSLADQFDIPLFRLIDFNDLNGEEVIIKDQLIFLQRKRKLGSREYHVVQRGESLYDICQTEGIRIESLQEMNRLANWEEPSIGERLYLQSPAPSKPRLVQKVDQRHDNMNGEEKNSSGPPVSTISHEIDDKKH